MNIEWLNNAKTDLLTLFAFYESKSTIVAVKMYNGIIEEVEILATQPYLGKVESLLEGLEFPFRSLVTKSGLYKIIYFIDGDTVYISRIWNCRQDPRNINKR